MPARRRDLKTLKNGLKFQLQNSKGTKMLSESLKGRRPGLKPNKPIWTGPSGEGANGGITFSALSDFLKCRERFRLKYVEGLRGAEQFSHRLEYGQMWHVCEEALAKGNDPTRGNRGDRAEPLWLEALRNYVRGLCTKYRMQQEQVDHWYNVCKAQFPRYVEHWKAHPDVAARTPLLQEQVFDVPYPLPSGRTVRLRGKWDSVDLVGKEVWLQENKTKGDIDEVKMQRQLRFDLQIMLYLVALKSQHYDCREPFTKYSPPIAGVRYNVVRRPLSGGKGTIVRHKATAGAKCPKCKGNGLSPGRVGVPIGKCPKCSGEGRVGGKPEETKEAFYGRLSAIIKEEAPTFFYRWNVNVTSADVQRFRQRFLDPILEQLCDWYADTTGESKYPSLNRRTIKAGYVTPLHWQHPYGCDNPMDAGYGTEYDNYLETGSEVGLVRTAGLFGELR